MAGTSEMGNAGVYFVVGAILLGGMAMPPLWAIGLVFGVLYLLGD
jgi:hypothetical protein